MGFSGGSVVKNPPAKVGDAGFDSWVKGEPLQEEMATLSSIIAWRIPWTEEPGRLPSTSFAKSRTQLSAQTHKLACIGA